MRTTLASILFLALAAGIGPGPVSAQTASLATEVAEPFKLGTFQIDGQDRLGIVLRDQFVVDLHQANHNLERNYRYAPVPMPDHMISLIERYDYGLKNRIYEIVNYALDSGHLSGSTPAYVHRVQDIRTLAPIQRPYPTKILNAAVNYFDHISEGASDEEREQAIAERQADRGHPYLFHKTVEGGVIGDGDTIVIPYGRDRADWEVELSAVIGRTAKYVPATEADDHIFGYTIQIDVSDRGGRPGGGSDWYVGKGRDTYAPIGPWITPKEFFEYPNRHIGQRLLLNGATMQDSGTDDMIHSVAELIEYGSSVSTLYPGDVVAAGSPAGVGSGIAVRGYQWFMQDGDFVVAEIEGIGALRHPVRQETSRPDGTGSFLPPTPWSPDDAPSTPWETEPTVDRNDLRWSQQPAME